MPQLTMRSLKWGIAQSQNRLDSFREQGANEEPTQAYFQYVEECDEEGNEVIGTNIIDYME